METESIGRYCRLTTLYVALRVFEVRFERLPGFLSRLFTMPLSDVAGEECGASDYDQADVDQLSWSFFGVGCVCHICVLVDGGEDVGDRFGVIVDSSLECGFG